MLTPKVVAPGEGKVISPIGGDQSRVLATGADTGGQYAILEQIVPPGHGPRKHVHRREEEAFCILEGQFGFIVGDQEILVGPGSYVLGPRDVPHTFWNAGPTPGRFLLIISPPGFETFFERFSDLLATAPKNFEKQAELAGEYGVEFVP